MEISPADLAGVFSFYPLLASDGKSYTYTYNRLLSNLYLVEGLSERAPSGSRLASRIRDS